MNIIKPILMNTKQALEEAVCFVEGAYGPHNKGLIDTITGPWKTCITDVSGIIDNVQSIEDVQVSWRDVQELAGMLNDITQNFSGDLDDSADLELLICQLQIDCGSRSYAESLLRRFRSLVMDVPNGQ
jgi:hypothetical protein